MLSNLIDRSKERNGNLAYDPNAPSEDAAFTFADSPLSITELCMRHQYCEHAKGKEKRLDAASAASAGIGASQDPFSEALKKADQAGIEAFTQLFLQ